ncbi:PREDICTED: peroxidase 3-like [Tarenaya hassleriana]|uniref:peroxidase 3-like n=1 Tax=Tarenaya hassleriana TaxID=28532 RepID=UPI00053C5C2B|nr:PREDICTED: peroxidase 3-like [Tarenaya hassleriana]
MGSGKVRIVMVIVAVTLAAGMGKGAGDQDGEGEVNSGLKKYFYKESCPVAEDVIRNITWRSVAADPALPAKLLRMSFHDCFVRGCDASVLIRSTAENEAEMEAEPNLTLGGTDLVDEIKAKLEQVCNGIVSCADIIPLATTYAVAFQFKMPIWEVFTGRRDGRISKMEEANANIPSPSMNFHELLKSFEAQGLNKHDLVVLSGGHTIGEGHCFLFNDRLYNFSGRVGNQDPSLDPDYAKFLKTKCSPSPTDLTTVHLDPDSGFSYDNHYFTNLLQNRGLFLSDAALLTDPEAFSIVQSLTDNWVFSIEFAKAMKKLTSINVETGDQGEIRQHCGFVNPTVSTVTAHGA